MSLRCSQSNPDANCRRARAPSPIRVFTVARLLAVSIRTLGLRVNSICIQRSKAGTASQSPLGLPSAPSWIRRSGSPGRSHTRRIIEDADTNGNCPELWQIIFGCGDLAGGNARARHRHQPDGRRNCQQSRVVARARERYAVGQSLSSRASIATALEMSPIWPTIGSGAPDDIAKPCDRTHT